MGAEALGLGGPIAVLTGFGAPPANGASPPAAEALGLGGPVAVPAGFGAPPAAAANGAPTPAAPAPAGAGRPPWAALSAGARELAAGMTLFEGS